MGYTGRKLEHVADFVEGIDALLVDIRFAPRSRNPDYDGVALSRKLGQRYLHLRAWGNRNYKGGPVELVDFEGGLRKVEGLPHETCILLCACSDAAKCHRTLVGSMLSEHGYGVHELGNGILQLPLC